MYKNHGVLKTVQLFKASFSKEFLDWLTSSTQNASYVCDWNFSYNIYTPDELVDMANEDVKSGEMSEAVRAEFDGLRKFCQQNDFDNIQIPI